VAQLWDQPGISYVECDALFTSEALPDGFPHDPYFPYTPDDYCGQWYLHNDGSCGCKPLVCLNALEAWEICYAQDPILKAGTKIGILDTRVNGEHDELEPYISRALSGSFMNDSLWWVNDEDLWSTGGSGSYWDHGTGMAGVAGAGTDDTLGIASLANIPPGHADSILVALVTTPQFLEDYGQLSAGTRALAWICDSTGSEPQIRIANMSWGTQRWKFCHALQGTEGLKTLRDACRNAFRKGINLTCSAGNGVNYNELGNPCGLVTDSAFAYPAAFPDYALAVGAMSCEGGTDADFIKGSYLDVAGPGVGEYRLGMVPAIGDTVYMGLRSGTSPAAAVIASALALLLGAQDCVFRSIPAADSGASRPPIPVEGGHRFRWKPAGHSGAFRPPLGG